MRRRLAILAASVLTGSLVSAWSPAAGDPQAASTLAKSVRDVTNPGANPVNHGDVLNWVLDYTNNGPAGPSTATITDQLAGAGTFVPGSLRVPPGWTPGWSTDGTNFQGSDQGTATVAVRGTNPNARPGGTTLDGQLLKPVQPTVTPGDAPQVCFQTTVPAACTTTQVTNTATGTDVTGALSSNTVTLPVAPGSACQPNVTVNKEICASSHIHDCKAGGFGPWKKKATVGILGLLFANPHWRITITNSGPVDIVNARINDSVEPSCVAAAGTLTLAAGASKQVFCNTSILISLLPLINTASATFTPANSPPGTPPTTTAPSSATACSLLCIL
jgi:uncharacterized repeat protein (TIGR01451 family)